MLCNIFVGCSVLALAPSWCPCNRFPPRRRRFLFSEVRDVLRHTALLATC